MYVTWYEAKVAVENSGLLDYDWNYENWDNECVLECLVDYLYNNDLSLDAEGLRSFIINFLGEYPDDHPLELFRETDPRDEEE